MPSCPRCCCSVSRWRPARSSSGASAACRSPDGVVTMDRHLAAARWWYALVALPMFQFLVYRALWRWGIWIQMLWRLSRLRLQPVATHPDLAGGLEFLSWPSIGFGHVIAALSATQAGVWADQVIYAGLKVTELKWQALVFALAGLAVALGPLLVVSGCLWRCQIDGQHEYGSLATDYTRLFHARWIARREPGRRARQRGPPVARRPGGRIRGRRQDAFRAVRPARGDRDRRRGVGADGSGRAARGAAG